MAFQKSQADMWAFRSRGQGRRKRPHRGDFRPAQPHSGRRPGVSASESPMALYGLPRAGQFSGDRTSVVLGRSVSVRVALGGCRILKKKKTDKSTREKKK